MSARNDLAALAAQANEVVDAWNHGRLADEVNILRETLEDLGLRPRLAERCPSCLDNPGRTRIGPVSATKPCRKCKGTGYVQKARE